MRYFLTVGNVEYEVGIDDGQETGIELDGQLQSASLLAVSGPLSLLKHGSRTYQVFISGNSGEYQVSIAGRKYTVQIEDEKARLVKSLIKLDDTRASRVELKAPMPGLIVKLDVKEGEEVQPGQSVCVIEAMKMENEIRATIAGKVSKIFVQEGDSVEKDAVLVLVE